MVLEPTWWFYLYDTSQSLQQLELKSSQLSGNRWEWGNREKEQRKWSGLFSPLAQPREHRWTGLDDLNSQLFKSRERAGERKRELVMRVQSSLCKGLVFGPASEKRIHTQPACQAPNRQSAALCACYKSLGFELQAVTPSSSQAITPSTHDC